eukprot:COSAG02_NODE_11735_length_1664_cov_13.306070_1_plen_238_part_01
MVVSEPEPEPEPEPEQQAAAAARHSYALLTTGGLECVLAKELSSCIDDGAAPTAVQGDEPLCVLPPGSRVWIPPAVRMPAGYGAGKAGSASPVIVESPLPLEPAVLRHPCVSAPLALALHTELTAAQLSSAEQTAAVLLAAADDWSRAARTWAAANPLASSGDCSFRVGTLRGGGKHTFSSRKLDAALGAAISDSLQPEWSVDLGEPDVLVICLLLHTSITVGLLLPPFRPKRSSVLP